MSPAAAGVSCAGVTRAMPDPRATAGRHGLRTGDDLALRAALRQRGRAGALPHPPAGAIRGVHPHGMTPCTAPSTILSGVEVHESSPPAATAAGIVPRWEWRTFGERFGEAEAAFAARAPERVQESDELYLLSVGGGDTVKVRDDLMDVKHLERVNDNGLEQWLPVLKAEFPLPAKTVESVLASLRIAAGPLARDEYTLVQLLEEVVTPKPALRSVEVHKRRA